MRLFVYEHVTGGGLAGTPLPPGLLREADLMVRTLLEDLAGCPGIQPLSSRDARLSPVPGVETLRVGAQDDPRAMFTRGASAADAVWPTAPETGGALEQLSREVVRLGRILLGCWPDAVRVAASKHRTARALASAGIPVVPTCAAGDPLPMQTGRWVTKPDDGAGAEGALLADSREAAERRLRADPGRLVAQPWLEGAQVSLSLLCHEGESLLLCANRQQLRLSDGSITLAGIAVNGIADPTGELAALGGRIASALPGLWGYVGVDLVLTDRGPVVLEINPRLTTSYCGIRRALDINVAAMVLDLLEPGAPARWRRPPPGSVVELTLEA